MRFESSPSSTEQCRYAQEIADEAVREARNLAEMYLHAGAALDRTVWVVVHHRPYWPTSLATRITGLSYGEPRALRTGLKRIVHRVMSHGLVETNAPEARAGFRPVFLTVQPASWHQRLLALRELPAALGDAGFGLDEVAGLLELGDCGSVLNRSSWTLQN